MRPDKLIRLSVFATLLAALLITQQNVRAAETADDYTNLKATVTKNLTRLETLGGGMKPFNDRVSQLDKLNETDQAAALSQLKSLSTSIDQQIKSVAELRARKPLAQKSSAPKKIAMGPSTSSSSTSIGREQTDSLVLAFVQKEQAKGNSAFNDASFNGTGHEYINAVANDIINREFNGLGFPCKGPFQLERFRNLHRISEMKKQGRDVSNWLAYHNQSEQIAAAAKHEPGRVPELSQRVRYLEQQLGMTQLSAGSFQSPSQE